MVPGACSLRGKRRRSPEPCGRQRCRGFPVANRLPKPRSVGRTAIDNLALWQGFSEVQDPGANLRGDRLRGFAFIGRVGHRRAN